MLSIHLMGITDVVLSCPTIDCSDDEVGMASERELCAKMVADLEGAVGLDFGLSNLSYSRLRIHDVFFTLTCYCSGLSFSCCFANGRLGSLLLCDARTDVLTGWVKRVIIALTLGYITLANFHFRKAPFPAHSPQLGPRSTLTRILEQPSQALDPPTSSTIGLDRMNTVCRLAAPGIAVYNHRQKAYLLLPYRSSSPNRRGDTSSEARRMS